MITEAIPRHGAGLVRLTMLPQLSAAERMAWIAAREWPVWGAIAGLVILVIAGPRLAHWELDPALIAGYLAGLVATRMLARGIRVASVRLEVATVSR